MRKNFVLIAAAIAFVGCGGTEPSGTLTVSVQSLPALTSENSVEVVGTVTRSPASEVVMTIAIAGGTQTVTDSLPPDGSFSHTIGLRQNQENQLAITASDETGSVSDPVIIVIFHDNIGPRISTITPRNRRDGVERDTPIRVEFAEPLTPSSASDGIELFHNSSPVAGTSRLSDDSTTLIFEPNNPTLHPNSVYEVQINGFSDEAGNPPGGDQAICFLTESDPFPVDSVDDESSGGVWVGGDPGASLEQPDLVRARFALADSTLYGVLRFNSEKTFTNTGDANASVLIDLDLDQDPGTGFRSIYDFIFNVIPEVTSGLGAEIFIGMEPREDFGDSAYVGVLQNDSTEFNVIDLFRPGVCGRFFGFDTDVLFGDQGDDGNFDFAMVALSSDDGGTFFDPVPDTGKLTMLLAPPGPTPSSAAYRFGEGTAIWFRDLWGRVVTTSPQVRRPR